MCANTFHTVGSIKGLRCSFVGYIAKYSHAIRCYVSDKYGHETSQCFIKAQQRRKHIWHKFVKEFPTREHRLVMHHKTWVRNVSQKCVRNVDNNNTTQPIKNLWVRNISQECANDGENNCTIPTTSDCCFHC